ncbi:MAG: Rieske (2Fe-2S) protein [Planctomycetota bacterium]
MTDETKIGSSATEEGWLDVLASEALREGQGRDVVIADQIIAVFRHEDVLYAMDGMCAHQGGPIAEGSIGKDAQTRDCVTCPWHGWQYELKTGIQTINRQPLQAVFPVREVDGQIQVNLNRI